MSKTIQPHPDLLEIIQIHPLNKEWNKSGTDWDIDKDQINESIILEACSKTRDFVL